MARRRKEGRPKKPGARTRSGRLSRAHQTVARDDGTPELRRQRLALVNGAADPALSASLAGILFAHHVIDGRRRNAADRFRRARGAVFGVVLSDRDPNRPEASEKRAAANERRYEAMCAKLDVEQLRAVIDLALDLRPGWLCRALLGLAPASDDQRERAILLGGLDRLAEEPHDARGTAGGMIPTPRLVLAPAGATGRARGCRSRLAPAAFSAAFSTSLARISFGLRRSGQSASSPPRARPWPRGPARGAHRLFA